MRGGRFDYTHRLPLGELVNRMDFGIERRFKTAMIGASSAISFSIAFYGYLNFFPEYAFHIFISLAIIILCAGLAVIIYFDDRRKEGIDDSLPALLQDLAECQETGMTLLQSLEDSSRRKYGPITSELKKLVGKLSWGVEFKEAFKSFGERLNTNLTEKIVTIILEAVYLGGDLKNVFLSTEKFVKKILEMRKERKSQIRPYLLIIYTNMIIFLAIVVILNRSFFSPLSVSRSRFLRFSMSSNEFRGTLFDLAVIEAFFGGLIAGKVSEGRIFSGLKHSVILLLITQIIFNLFLA